MTIEQLVIYYDYMTIDSHWQLMIIPQELLKTMLQNFH